jgi:DeoR/GlpR family transcriptional regulator of sugar metabolism
MLLEKRRQEIIKLAEVRQGISIKELAEHFDVSTMTILRDIKVLQKRKVVESVRGGVLPKEVVKDKDGSVNYYEYKKRSASLDKQKIASYCVDNLITDKMVVGLEGGSTVASMVKFLANKKRLTLLTNGLYVAQESSYSLDVTSKIILSGGLLEKDSYLMLGKDTEDFFKNKFMDIAFISCVAFDLTVGPMDSNPLDIQAKQAMFKNAKRRVLVLDQSKFDARSVVPTMDIAEITDIVTNAEIKNEIKESLGLFKAKLHFV